MMTRNPTHRMTMTICVTCIAIIFLAGASIAQAQSRAGTWEFELGVLYQLGEDIDFEGGSTMETDNEFGIDIMVGYNLSDKLETTFGVQWSGIGYDARVIDEDDGIIGISGTYDSWALSGDLIYNFSEGAFTPFVGAGIGYTWIDTNIPNGLPSTGCWWDPWWGWVCYTSYPTKSTSSFSYQAMAGVRYEFNRSTFTRLTYTSQWMDVGVASSTPRFDVFSLSIGWMF